MNRKTFISVTLALCVPALLSLLAGCGQKADPPGSSKTSAVEPVAVRVQLVVPSLIVDRVILPCCAEAYDEVKISAEVAGRITRLTHDEGEPVKAGELLFLCDTEKLQTDVDRAKAAYELAQASFERIQSLASSKYGQATAEQVDRAVAERDSGKANLESCKVLLDRATIRSPIDGFLERRYVDVGVYVNPGTPVANVVCIDKLKIYVDVPEREVSHIEIGGQILLHFKFDGEGDFPGVIDNIDRVGDPVTRTYRTRIIMDNKDGHIRPKMIGSTILLRGKPRQGISVPLDALIARKGRRYVVLALDGKALERDVDIGVFDGQNVEITKGLAAGDRIIIEGQRQVGEGDPVRVVEDAASSSRNGATAAHQPPITESSHETQ